MTNEIIFLKKETPNTDLFVVENLFTELNLQRKTISIAEGCTGGSILNKITIPGSTKVFKMGIIAYSQRAKIELGVKNDTIRMYGEYSPEVVLEMARSVRRIRDDSLGIATVGELASGKAYSWVHSGYSFDNGKSFSQSIPVKKRDRSFNKSYIANMVLVNCLLLLTNNKLSFANDVLFDQINNPFLSNELTTLTARLVHFLNTFQLTVSTIESCTGGAIADAITNISGASKIFQQGWVTYDENAKIMLGVPESTMAFGKVYSPDVAEEMAKALRRKTSSDLIISTTGTMDNLDTRPYHSDIPPGTIFYSIIFNGQLVTKHLQIRPKERRLMKEELVTRILEDVLSMIFTKYSLYSRTSVRS